MPPPSFRKNRVRVVSLHKVPRVSAQALEAQLSLAHAAFAEIPAIKSNILKLEVTIANDDFDDTLTSLGVERSEINAMVVLEADSHAKIQEFLKDPVYQKMFEGSKDHAVFGRSSTIAFSGDVMTVIDE